MQSEGHVEAGASTEYASICLSFVPGHCLHFMTEAAGDAMQGPRLKSQLVRPPSATWHRVSSTLHVVADKLVYPMLSAETHAVVSGGSSSSGAAAEACEECSRRCERQQSCGHACPLPCHTNPCPPCLLELDQACHCGRSLVSVVCHQLQQVRHATPHAWLGQCANGLGHYLWLHFGVLYLSQSGR